ncbi:AI-2E family transporter [soil metagenome]
MDRNSENGADHRLWVRLPKPVSVSIVGIFVLLLMGAMWFARGFFLPIILAILISLTFAPLTRFLRKHGIPSLVSAVLIVVGMFAALVLGSLYLAEPMTTLFASAPEITAQLKIRLSDFREPLSEVIKAGEQMDAMTQPGDAPAKVVIAQPGIASWAADTLSGLGATLGATLILVLFMLSSGDLFLQKLIRVVPTLTDKKRSLRIVYDVESEVSRYLLTITVINIGFGIAVGLAMWSIGLSNPVLWGVAAAGLNFIPYVGAIIGTAASAITGMLTFEPLTMALLPPAIYLGFHIVESALVTPLTLGRRLELNPVAIFITLAFWSWMWGIVGALIAVPILVVVKVFCDNLPSLTNVGEFLSGEAPAPETAEQREQQAVK